MDRRRMDGLSRVHAIVWAAFAAAAMAGYTGVGLGAERNPTSPFVGPPEPAVAGYGRFEVLFAPGPAGEAYLLDTRTGRVWVRTRAEDRKAQDLVGPSYWNEMVRVDAWVPIYRRTRAGDNVLNAPMDPVWFGEVPGKAR